MIEICNKEKCTGCWACVNKCPKQCITMKVGDKLGHLYPEIDSSVCIDCRLCEKICPANNPIEVNQPLIAYAGCDKNIAEYQSSTSGGAASALSRFIIRQGGVVYGCAMQKGLNVHHIRITNEDELFLLKGSKYVQSKMEHTYQEAFNDLKSGKKVLFIGTPCQVAAMKKIAGKWSSQLYTVDLICHGVPSLDYLQKYAKEKVGDISNVIASFRSSDGMYLLLLLLLLPNGDVKELYSSNLWQERYKDIYFNSFMDGFTYRPSCYSCPYANRSRVSDITIGDFWGLGMEEIFSYSHPYGCSVLLPLTVKGHELLRGIQDEFNLYQRNVDEAIKGNSQLRHSVKKTRIITLFSYLHPIIGISNAYHLCVVNKRIVQAYYRIRASLSITVKTVISKCKR